MVQQSDVPSQTAPRRRARIFANLHDKPQREGLVVADRSVNVAGFYVSTFDARPYNATDFIFPIRPTDIISVSSGPGNYTGIAAVVTVPEGYVFIARKLTLTLEYTFGVQAPYAVPLIEENKFLTNVSGFPNVNGREATPTAVDGGAPQTFLTIFVDDQASPYQNIFLPCATQCDYNIPLYLPASANSIIKIQVVREINTVPVQLYGGRMHNMQMFLHGNLLHDTGLSASDEALTPHAIPVRETIRT